VLFRSESALRSKSAIELEDQLNAIGVPAAKVRTLSEFLEELSKGNNVNIPFASYEQDDKVIKTTGLGFSLDKASQSTKERSPNLGEHTYEILKDIGIDDNQIAKIIEANILK
jgi:crotonobetainyl-CoA:carnitine CoA-transferase CaiB-like acyl-CoA transferase